jgi:SAM-dependent methyltransferase
VLDVGCGSGRIGEFVLEAGASQYLGVDFSEPMIDLAKARLERFEERVELIIDDFLTAPITGPFDVVLALGLFDYLPDAPTFVARMFELCAPGGSMVGSFPAWSLVKGPVRKLRYEWIGNCPIFNYSADELRSMLSTAGFGHLELLAPGRSGYLVRARRS